MTEIEKEKRREIFSKNVRKEMVKQSLSVTHVQHVLKLEQQQIKPKLSGQESFTNDEIIQLAAYLGVPEEVLWSNSEAVPNLGGKKTAVMIKDSLERLKDAVTNMEELSGLLTMICKAKLSGKIDDLHYYLRNNLLRRAALSLPPGEKVLSAEDKLKFVAYYSEYYDNWKAEFAEGIDDVLFISLENTEFDNVAAAVVPTTKGRLTQFLTYVVKDHTGDEKLVDIASLSLDIHKAIVHLQRVKRLLDNYSEEATQ